MLNITVHLYKTDVHKYEKKWKKKFILTIIDSIDLINESFIGELCGQRGEQVNVSVQEEQRVKHWQDLILTTSKLPLHPQHHVGNVLRTNKEVFT